MLIDKIRIMWDVKWGNHIVDKNERERQWRLAKKCAKREFDSLDQWYAFMCKATGRV